jgi:hypothetical protein
MSIATKTSVRSRIDAKLRSENPGSARSSRQPRKTINPKAILPQTQINVTLLTSQFFNGIDPLPPVATGRYTTW